MNKLTALLWFAQYLVSVHGISSAYNVHTLDGAVVIERNAAHDKRPIDIYCYPGNSKNLLSLWQTVSINVKVKNDDFVQYVGNSPEEVYQAYTEGSSWSVLNPFQKKSNSMSVELYNTTCMALTTKHVHKIELNIKRIDIWRVFLMTLGLAFIFSSRPLSGNPIFFYLCGILIGVCASFMVVVYYFSKLIPKRTLTYGIMIGGWTVGIYIFQQMWDNIRSIFNNYQTHLMWYTSIVGFVSFLVCYRIGPPVNARSKNLVMWTLQAIGVLCIFFSSKYQEASAAIIVLALTIKYFPQSFILYLKGYWHRKFPPKPRLLSSDEYYEQGARETKHALDSLREYCSSPDCAQWRIMLKLNDSKRFASFIEGDSHLSNSEIIDYESYAFSLDENIKSSNRNMRDNMEISDDETDSDSDLTD